jgi:hypothetical protein
VLRLVHDQGPLAWFVVAAYLVSALLAFRAAAISLGRERGFWSAAAVLLILLGINKQLDLQSDLTDLARAAAHSGGWYKWRRDVQGVFLLAMALGTIAVAMLIWRLLRGVTVSARVAAMGLVILLAFIFLRAASFHHIDNWVTIPVAGMRSGWWLELLGIVVIGTAAAFRARPDEKVATSA